MSLSPAVIDALVASGATVEQLAAAVKADMAEAQARLMEKRERDAERQRKHRSRKVTVTPRDKGDPSPNDIYSNPLPEPNGAKAPCPPLVDRVVSAWNEGPGKAGATKARALDAGRRKLLALRVREHGEDAVFEAIGNLAASPFHCGENDRNWKATAGWLLKAENFLKALELAPQAANDRRPLSTAEQIAALKVKADGFDGWNPDRAAECRAEIRRLSATGPPGQPIGASMARAVAGFGHGQA